MGMLRSPQELEIIGDPIEGMSEKEKESKHFFKDNKIKRESKQTIHGAET